MQEWKWAVAAIFCSMLFDALDGLAARRLGANSRFGAQLDSLADLVSFGLAPAVVIYAWCLSEVGGAGWVAALIYCASSAIRLARFNVEDSRNEGASHSYPYFVGLPTPAAAGIMLIPLLLNLEFDFELVRSPLFCIGLIGATSLLMVSRVPTPSLKYLRISGSSWFFVLTLSAVLAVLAFYFPWGTLVLGLLVYISTIPFAILRARIAATAGERGDAAPIFSEDPLDGPT